MSLEPWDPEWWDSFKDHHPPQVYAETHRWIAKLCNWASVGHGGGQSAESDGELIAQVQARGPASKAAFSKLVLRHQGWLLHVISCLLGSPRDAEDVAQEVFLKAYLAMDRFRGDASFRTWTRRIAINQSFTHKTRGSRRPGDPGAEDEPPFPVDVALPMEAGLESREILIRVLRSLPHAYREILVLYHIEELSIAEIGTLLDLGPSAVKMRLKRSREYFSTAYTHLTGEEGYVEA